MEGVAGASALQWTAKGSLHDSGVYTLSGFMATQAAFTLTLNVAINRYCSLTY